MDLMEAITQRRSIHEYKPENVEGDLLEEIFNLATLAPTHRMKQAWNILLYQADGKEDYSKAVLDSYHRKGFFTGYELEKREQLEEGIREFLLHIPHHALIYMERDEDERKYEEDYASVCAYIQNVQLLAWEAGVGVLWTTSPYLHDPQFSWDIGLDPSKFKLVSVLQIGYPKRIPNPKKRTPIKSKLKVIDTSQKADV
ncbi:nitroreductase family protein [Halobacillus litoralis]|uniref:nitroreductase family protein n=1 Tax=Halobacillus litoralis TaxID=45668 RepID=UPI001CFDF7A0|nr:nitroreductase family protein [Halobacillus litoralis]